MFLSSFLLVGLPTDPGLIVGCDSNDDCPDYTSCRNRKCINPCAVDKPCAPSALCKVVNHNPVCTCPNGYIGSPHTRCTPRKSHRNNVETILYCRVFEFKTWLESDIGIKRLWQKGHCPRLGHHGTIWNCHPTVWLVHWVSEPIRWNAPQFPSLSVPLYFCMKFTFQLHNLNVWLTLTVLLILHALMRNVKTHALRCPAGFGPTARLKTTEQFVSADLDSLETPMRSVKNVSSKSTFDWFEVTFQGFKFYSSFPGNSWLQIRWWVSNHRSLLQQRMPGPLHFWKMWAQCWM